MTPELELDLRMAEPEPGSVVRLTVAFPGSPTSYTYVFLEVGGLWYPTGSADKENKSWDRIVNWLKSKNAEVISLEQATAWEDLL